MRASDLLQKDVCTADGDALGHVFELELQQKGPDRGGPLGPYYRVSALLVSERAWLLRLGFHGTEMKGPWGLGWLGRRTSGTRVQWKDISDITEDQITLKVNRADLEEL